MDCRNACKTLQGFNLEVIQWLKAFESAQREATRLFVLRNNWVDRDTLPLIVS